MLVTFFSAKELEMCANFGNLTLLTHAPLVYLPRYLGLNPRPLRYVGAPREEKSLSNLVPLPPTPAAAEGAPRKKHVG